MKYRNLNGGIFLLFVLVTSLSGAVVAGDRKGELDSAAFARQTKKLQMPFVANNGQVDERVKFYAKTFGGTVFVTKDGEIVYALPNNSSDIETQCLASLMHLPNGIQGNHVSDIIHPASWIVDYDKSVFQNPKSTSLDSKNLKSLNSQSKICNPQSKILSVALKEEFVGARIKTILGEEKSITKVNYFKGNDPSKWKANVSTYDMVNLGEIYKGIELRLKAYGNNVEKLFCVKPGASPEQIKISLSGIQPLKNPPPSSPSVRGTAGCPPMAGAGGGLGAMGLWINEVGQLVAETEFGPVKFTKPIAYQEINGKRVEVDVEYRIRKSEERSQIQGEGAPGAGERKTCNSKLVSTNPQSEINNPSPTTTKPSSLIYGFKVAAYDKTKDLIIDPLLASTYLGGSGFDGGYSLTLDTSGNIYVTGYTKSSDFPKTSGVYDTFYNGNHDVFVSKLDIGLTRLLASTYLGGSYSDKGYSLALDTSGNIYVTGDTESSDFPTTSGAYDTSKNSGDNIFVSKLDGGLTRLLASTYLGGNEGTSLVLDISGNVYVTGNAGSVPEIDAFVSKLDGGLGTLTAFKRLGRGTGRSLALDASGNVYVTGYTSSTNFPTTNGAYDTSLGGDGYEATDVFVSKLDSGLGTLTASTYLGGSYTDSGFSITLDASGNVYVTGFTSSRDFPTTNGVYDTFYNGNHDVFVSKLDGGLTRLLASTYLGGSNSDGGNSITLDTSGNVYVTGDTGSKDFPTTKGAYNTSYGGGSFISKLDGGLTSLLASTYLGRSIPDIGNFLVLDTSGNVYVTGETYSSNFATTNGAYDTSFNGSIDAFISKLDANLSASTTTPTPTPVSSATPTPSTVCETEKITVSPSGTLKLKRSKSIDATITVTGADNCFVEGETVTATINKSGQRCIAISPTSQETDENGQTTFTITALEKTGNARVTFHAGSVKKVLTVKVRK